jgi:3-hydroxyacyl-CoA dehydrogenase/enoyl-CoA hydratase/3-hydroxybutyryl-CoA epimerase
MTNISTVRWSRDTDNIITLTLDDPTQSANTMNDDYVRSMGEIIERLESERESITGVVVTSAKKTFFAGANLNNLVSAGPEDAVRFAEFADSIKAQFRRLETLGRPVVAAINGAALGGGLEVALATHYRIAVNSPSVIIGFPEVSLGLLAGVGGITRSVRMLGIEKALTKLLLEGQKYSATAAFHIGIVDAVVESHDELYGAAKDWIRKNPDAGSQPWDREGFKIPGGNTIDPSMIAKLREKLGGAPVEAPRAILAAAVEGAQVDVETATVIETRYFVHLLTSQISTNMIKSQFFDMQRIKSGASRPEGIAKSTIEKIGVVGAGMMGAAIAYASAKAGIDVVLYDLSIDGANAGKKYSENAELKSIARGTGTEREATAVLAKIVPTDDLSDFSGVDFVVEAVFENIDVKHDVFKAIQQIIPADAVLGSNTSTIPISDLADAVDHPENFVGIHFFSPADRMPLVEIISGAHTSDETLARAFDFTQQIRKVPIVVNDGRGFFTSRVIMTFLAEATSALGEGIDPSVIEQAALQAGYPAPPLQLLDELTLTLPQQIRLEARAAVESGSESWAESTSDRVLDRMISEFARKGRSTGAGFYDYDQSGRRLGLWPEIRTVFNSGSSEIPFADLQERMLFAEALESVRCLDEGVLNTVADANIGSLLGIGFPTWTGGVLQFINGYPGGLPGFVKRASALAERYGSRFEPPASLLARTERGSTYY